MQRIAKSIESIADHYEIVVIGSGYGGGIAASRLARAGRQVCLLERGREFLPGEFPNKLISATEHMQVHGSNGHEGSATGLFDFHIHKGISVLVGCGLGGTSLINANVSIRPEDRVFDDACWPEILREEWKDPNSDLQQGYNRATAMLKPNKLPDGIQVNKLKTLERSANANNLPFYRLDINVNFDVDGANHVGVQQKPCNLCGDCCSGCNNLAKNTTQMNYLPDAVNHGASIFTEAQVSHIEKHGSKWHVHFQLLDAGTQKFKEATSFVVAGKVIVAAGTLGSTEIMLRSKQKGLPISDKTGREFSGNGDVLGFGYNTDYAVDGIGYGDKTIQANRAPGPCITGVIDARNQPILEDGMVIEDAAVPGAIGGLIGPAMLLNSKLIGVQEETKHGFFYRMQRIWREFVSRFRGAHYGAVRNTQTYLVMSHDGESGKLELVNDRLRTDWSKVGKEPIFEKVDQRLRNATHALDGDYIKNPVWSKAFHQELITVHPLGGCFMGTNVQEAVVNHKGQVFDMDGGVHEGLYIMDGSIVPRSLGTNPLFTIAALAERCCAIMAKENDWHIDYAFDRLLQNTGKASTVGMQFTETMRGFYSTTGTNGDYAAAAAAGEQEGSSFVFTLSIRMDDVYKTIKEPNHAGTMEGTVIAPKLSAEPLTATDGVFQLFVDDPTRVNTKLMKYSMVLEDENERQYFFEGFKLVRHDKGLDEWPDTSTLYITLYNGNNNTAPVMGLGILHIAMADFAKQMTTMKAVNAPSVAEALKAEVAFGKYFARSLWDVYGGVFKPNHYFNPDAPARKKRPLKLGPPEWFKVPTADGKHIELTRYKGGDKGPILFAHPFNSSRYFFLLDTIQPNLIEYLYAEGYDLWIMDYRLSMLLPYSNDQHTLDAIAKYDWPAAIEKIRSVTGKPYVDLLGHCVGSITMFMAVLAGLQGVRSMLGMQIATDFYAAPQVKWKAGLHIPQLLEALGVESLSAFSSTKENWMEHLYDKFITLYGDAVTTQCNNPSCHRMTFMFGPLFLHNNLDEATHDATVEIFGAANMTTYEQLTRIIRHHSLLDADGNDTYMINFDRLNLPITFIASEQNGVFEPKSTQTTFTKLVDAFGPAQYAYHLLSNYGHVDSVLGHKAATDVYPLILQHFEKVNQPHA